MEALADNRDLQVLFVATHIDTYLADPDAFPLDDVFREEILRLEIDQVAKREIVKLMNLSAVVDLPERSALIGPIVNNTDISIYNLDGSVARSRIEHSRPITGFVAQIP